ncbi:MAG: hypothetical protein PUF13_12330 [Lachnospiraceae bacterium]|nr:hypothetical protein [Lachnospiraceae bacterium]
MKWKKMLTWVLASAMIVQSGGVLAAEDTESFTAGDTEYSTAENTEYSTVGDTEYSTMENTEYSTTDPIQTEMAESSTSLDDVQEIDTSVEETQSYTETENLQETDTLPSETAVSTDDLNTVYFSTDEGATVLSNGQDITNGYGEAENGTIIFSVVPDQGCVITSVIVDGVQEARSSGNENEYVVDGIVTDDTVITVSVDSYMPEEIEKETLSELKEEDASPYYLTGSATHIDISIASAANLSVGGKLLQEIITLTAEDIASMTITAVQNGNSVSFSAYQNQISIIPSVGNGGVIQASIPGVYPVGTKDAPVQYSLSFSKNVTFTDSETGMQYTRTMVFSSTFNYWDISNGCPVLVPVLAAWQTGYFIPFSGMDFVLGCSTDAMGYITVQKNVVDMDGNPIAGAEGTQYTFNIFNDSEEYVDSVVVSVDANGYGLAGTAVEFGTYFIEEVPALNIGEYEFADVTITPGNIVTVEPGNSAAALVVTNKYSVPETESESQTESESESQKDTESEPQTESESEPQKDTESEPQTESESEPQTDTESEPQTESESEPQKDTESEPQTDGETETESETIKETESETNSIAEETDSSQSGKDSDNRDSVATGDDTPIIPLVATLVLSLIVILAGIGLIIRRRRG